MPSQAAINMTFNRVNQSTLSWPSSKGVIKANQSKKALRCLLCIRGFQADKCERNANKFKKFCDLCWSSRTSKCKALLVEPAATTFQLLVFNKALSVLTEQTPDGKSSVPTVSKVNWTDEAMDFCKSLNLECDKVIQLMHPEDSAFKPDIPWVMLTVKNCNSQRELSPSMPHWVWMPNSVAVDELQITDSHRLETSTDYLIEVNSEADDLLSQVFGVDNVELDSLLETEQMEAACSEKSEAVTAQYSQCEHGFVLISGTADITLQPQCERPECVRLAEVPPEAAAFHAAAGIKELDLILGAEQVTVDEVCLNCTKPLIHSYEDPTIRCQLIEACFIEAHKVKFEPVLQQLLYDLHYFENMQVIQHGSTSYTLTYSQIQPWRLCSCPHCFQCKNRVAAGPLQTRLHSFFWRMKIRQRRLIK